MNEQELTAFTGALQDIEKLHAKVGIIETKYIAMFAAVKSSLDKAGIEFELDETYLNELLDITFAGVPYATEAQINGDIVAADHERLKAEPKEPEDLSPKVISNTGEVATFAGGMQISRQRPASWPRGFTQNRVHQSLPISAVVMNYQVFKDIFAVGSTLNQVQSRLLPPAMDPGAPQRIQNPGAAIDGEAKER